MADIIADIIRVVEFDSTGQLREVWYEASAPSGETHVCEAGNSLVIALPVGGTQQGFKMNLEYGSIAGFKVACLSDLFNFGLLEEDPLGDVFAKYGETIENISQLKYEVNNDMVYYEYDEVIPYVAYDDIYLYMYFEVDEQATKNTGDTIFIRLFANKMYSSYSSANFRRA